MTKRIHVGIIGANRGWAAQAHIPALAPRWSTALLHSRDAKRH